MTLRATTPTLLLIDALLMPGDHYGVSLAQDTGIGAGTLYPLLSRLVDDYGWLTVSKKPNPNPKRPDRKYYKLTQKGKREAIALLELHADRLDRLRTPLPRKSPFKIAPTKP
jgi:PadR family transcriptional regulator, regulatory protein PadR